MPPAAKLMSCLLCRLAVVGSRVEAVQTLKDWPRCKRQLHPCDGVAGAGHAEHCAARKLCVTRAAKQAAPARARAAAPADKGEALLIVERLAKSHDGERMLMEGLTFTLARGERLSIVGENGAGKSTLLRLLAGAALAPSYSWLLTGKSNRNISASSVLARTKLLFTFRREWR